MNINLYELIQEKNTNIMKFDFESALYNLFNIQKIVSDDFSFFIEEMHIRIIDIFYRDKITNRPEKITKLRDRINHYPYPVFKKETEDEISQIYFGEYNNFPTRVDPDIVERISNSLERSISFYEHIKPETIRNTLYSISYKYYLLSIIEFLQSGNNPVSRIKARELAIIAARYYPKNYIIYQIIFLTSHYKSPQDRMSFNLCIISLRKEYLADYNASAIYQSENGNYENADRIIQQGLIHNYPGSKYLLQYSRAQNLQEYLLNKNLKSPHILLKIKQYCQQSICDLIISLDRIIEKQTPLNESYLDETFLYSIMNSYNVLSLCHTIIEERHEAIQVFTEGINLAKRFYDPNKIRLNSFADLIANRGIQYMKLEKYNEALHDFYNAIQYPLTNRMGAILNISNCFYRTNQPIQMVSILLREISDAGDQMQNFYFNLCLGFLKERDLAHAIKYAKKYADLTKDYSLEINLAILLFELGKHNEGIEKLENAIKNGQIDAQYHLSIKHMQDKRMIEAKELFLSFIDESKNEIFKTMERFKTNIRNEHEYFKYKPINKYTYQMLNNDYLYFSDIDKLNDPFDSRIIQEYNRNDIFKESINESGIPKILSLTSNDSQNQLLWSHYAEEHRGIRIGYKFNSDKLLDKKIVFFPVSYIDSIKDLEIHFLNNLKIPEQQSIQSFLDMPAAKSFFLNSMLKKEKSWSYEDEWRLINYTNNFIYDKDLFSITSITFGCRTPKKDMKSIIRTLKNQPQDPDKLKDNILYNSDHPIQIKKMKESQTKLYQIEYDSKFSITDFVS